MQQLLKGLLERVEPLFEKGGKLEKMYPAYDAFATLAFVLPNRTHAGAHIRDDFDSKRMMVTVIFALIPCTLVGVFNIGFQRLLAMGVEPAFGPAVVQGLIRFLPILIVTYAVGLGWEFLFAVIRRHEVSEGFLVSGFLVALIVPPSIPLWQLAVATTFGVIIGKEIFGGTGMNIFNPALVVRAFLFFAYPAQISGDRVWVALDGYASASPLAIVAEGAEAPIVDVLAAQGVTWFNSFIGLIPGSIGETSTLAILLGIGLLLITGVGSWRIMLSMLAGGVVMAGILNLAAPHPGHFLALPIHYHLTLGGFAFGLAYMATDPVSAAATDTGKLIYGFLCGVLSILVRILNPAFPEGVMLAILFMNMFAPLIDHFVVRSNVKKRLARATVPATADARVTE
ncbi:MAG: NADH:ubiquinone reductase (Na(+)-transporting) subunit B [Spirochaetaceae bacterium]|nr:NADH:ubiquinone reductase (Na(+)-transporting) subunit B [Spirochaetaceae bacterium]